MITKSALVHGKYYWGHCRNASTARWNAETQRFVYWRHKFGDRYAEEICHPDDDDRYDVFTPTEEVTWGTPAIPLTA